MTVPTKLLVRWQYGYTSVGSGDKLGYLTLGSLSKSAARRVALKELERLANAGEQISLGADPDPVDPADGFGSGWDVGDFVNVPTRTDLSVTSPARVLQVSVTEDDDGALTVLPELSALVDQIGVRTQRWLDRMADGTLKGSSAVAQPIVTPEHVPARRPGQTTQTFSWQKDAILNWRTAPWTPEVRGRLAQMHLKRGRSATPVSGDIAGDLRVAFIVNGVTLDEGIIWSGEEEGTFGGTGVDFGPADKLELQPTEVPSGTVSLTARVIQTHYH